MKKVHNLNFWERGFVHNSSNYIFDEIYRNELEGRGDLLVLDVGCGGKPFEKALESISKGYFGLDIVKTGKNDILGDAKKLPFSDNIFDLVICSAVFEHDPYPQKIVDEIYRVLKNGGSVIAVAPFAEVSHGFPEDYYRFTYYGIKHLFRGSRKIKIYQDGGFFKSVATILGDRFCDLQYINVFTKALGVLGFFKILGVFMYPIINIPCRFLDWIFFRQGEPLAGAFPCGHWVLAKK